MKNSGFACLGWTAIFLALCGVSGWFVFRRAPTAGAAFFGGLIGGVLLLIVLAWLLAIPKRIAEWWLIVRARLGGEPRDGKRCAILGTLRGHGELAAPFTRERCVAYAYEIVVSERNGNETTIRDAYEGFAMVPLAIEHGAERTRILAKPEIAKWRAEHPASASAHANARQYLETAKLEPKPKNSDANDLTSTDGRLRHDYRDAPGDVDLDTCRLVERHLDADTPVCALGTYSADRRALLGPVTLRTGSAFAIGAAWRVVNAGIAVAIVAAITLAAAGLFLANFPLDAVEQSHPHWNFRWWEIDLERFVAKHVRGPMVAAGMLNAPGYHLQEVCDGCAKGTLEVNGRAIELRHATYLGGTAVHLSARPGDRDGVTLADSRRVVLTIDGKSAEVPASWLQPGDVETSLRGSEYAGRVTVVAPDRWIRCRVSFKTQVDPDAWLRRGESGERRAE